MANCWPMHHPNKLLPFTESAGSLLHSQEPTNRWILSTILSSHLCLSTHCILSWILSAKCPWLHCPNTVWCIPLHPPVTVSLLSLNIPLSTLLCVLPVLKRQPYPHCSGAVGVIDRLTPVAVVEQPSCSQALHTKQASTQSAQTEDVTGCSRWLAAKERRFTYGGLQIATFIPTAVRTSNPIHF
jgi:hypothetical protein